MEPQMIRVNSIIAASSIAAVAGLLAGCGGGSSTSSTGNGMPATTQSVTQSQPLGVAEMKGKCPSDNGVSVSPCTVMLSVSNPIQTVTTKGPNGGTFTFKDMRCTKNNVATIAGTGNSYTVTAGTSTGMCAARFIDRDNNNKRIGIAKLTVKNHI
jgi:hypothetical protein